MKVYVFGNQDYEQDSTAYDVVEIVKLEPWYNEFELEFINVKPNEDLPFIGEKRVVILDVVKGISDVKLIMNEDIERLKLHDSSSVHDFDLGFQIMYLKKLKKLGDVFIIGIPFEGRIDYDSIHSIVKKLVAHDIQGS